LGDRCNTRISQRQPSPAGDLYFNGFPAPRFDIGGRTILSSLSEDKFFSRQQASRSTGVADLEVFIGLGRVGNQVETPLIVIAHWRPGGTGGEQLERYSTGD
jgi:hypothetical protein